jgi:N-acetylglucosaminyl-diphospho-decaprenol L-rhamnosyltransferase
LYAVQASIGEMEAEVIVIDNHSTENGIEDLKASFPWVTFIINEENIGYSRANNQGWKMAKGNYVLFLNPDTILSETCLQKSLAVFLEKPEIGALGIRMIDGSGYYLPESKRGFPYAATAFYKLSGITSLFPHSKTFSEYYLGYLQENENQFVDALSGAYMMVRRKVLELTGGFDENFFMYGEDLDLCYRIHQAGYYNYYLGEPCIIHFKGESTRKDIKYVKLFYKAMDIFVKKHYAAQSWLLRGFLNMAIQFRSGIAYIGKIFSGKVERKQLPATMDTLVAGGIPALPEIMEIINKVGLPKRNIMRLEQGLSLPNKMGNTATEIIFCANDIRYDDMMAFMQKAPGKFIYKFHHLKSKSIVGSNSKNSKGEILV